MQWSHIIKICINVIKDIYLVFLATICFAVAVTIAPIAYGYGATPIILVFFRFAIVAIVGYLFSIRQIKTIINKTNIRHLVILSASLGTLAYSYMMAIQLLPLSVAVILFYTFPIITYIANTLINKQKINIYPIILLIIALFGIYFIINDGNYKLNTLGVFFGFMSAITQTLINITANKLTNFNKFQLLKISATAPALIFLILLLLNYPAINNIGLILSVISGLLFCLATLLFFYSITKIGSVRTANIMYFEVIFTVAIATIAFQEILSLWQWLGIILIVVAAFTLELYERKKDKHLKNI